MIGTNKYYSAIKHEMIQMTQTKTGSEQYMETIEIVHGYINVGMFLTTQEYFNKARNMQHDLETEAGIYAFGK